MKIFKLKRDNGNENMNYQMKDQYDSGKLVVANLEYISNERTEYGPMIITTEQKYIFEPIVLDDTVKYREVFTGFIADTKYEYFNLPYVKDVKPLKEVISNIANKISKCSLLLVLNKTNQKQNKPDNNKKYTKE